MAANVRERIRKYFDAERFVERTTPQLSKEPWWKEFRSLVQDGPDYFEYLAGQTGNGITKYDLLCSRQRPYLEWMLEKLSEKVASAGTESPRVLDVCCGTGLEAVFLGKEFPKSSIIGIDLSESMLEAARRRAVRNGTTNVSFEQGNRDKLNPDRRGYNLLTCLSSLMECTPEFYGLHAEIYRRMYIRSQIAGFREALAPRGKIVIALNHIVRPEEAYEEELFRNFLDDIAHLMELEGLEEIEHEETSMQVEDYGKGIYYLITGTNLP